MRKDSMTTVVNYNILNIFGNSADKPGGGNVRSNTGQLDRGKNYTPEDDLVIDVTPFSKIMSDRGTDDTRVAKFPTNIDRQASAHTAQSSNNTTYERTGNAIPYIYPKGIHIDSYV